MFGDVIEDAANVRLIASAAHGAEHFVLSVLQRHVEVGNNLFARAKLVDQLRRNRIRIGIQHAEPVDAVDALQMMEQVEQHGPTVAILTVAGGVLRNQRKLAYAAVGQTLCLVDELFERFTDEIAANQRNCAVGAAVVAAVRDSKICAVARRGQHPR